MYAVCSYRPLTKPTSSVQQLHSVAALPTAGQLPGRTTIAHMPREACVVSTARLREQTTPVSSAIRAVVGRKRPPLDCSAGTVVHGSVVVEGTSGVVV